MRALALVTLALCLACGVGRKETVILLPTDDGTEASVTVGDEVTLDQPLTMARYGRRGSVEKTTTTTSAVEAEFSETLAAFPSDPEIFTLYFSEAGIEVVEDSKEELERLLAEVASRAAVEVEITGHTDRVGKVEVNDQLAFDRAIAVREKLLELGIQSDWIRAVGRGEREPVARPDEDEVAEPLNRRVVVTVR